MKRTGKFELAVAAAVILLGTTAWAQNKTYTLDADFDLGTLLSVNHNAPNSNQLQLDAQSQSDPFGYIAMPSEGDLVKIDTTTMKQVGRYPSVYVASCPSCPPANHPCDFNGYCGQWDPSRTAVDADGNVWVANRSFGNNADAAQPWNAQGSITKIGNKTAGTCVDRNNNGVIDTSNDANNDGVVNKLDPAEYLGQNDECLIKSYAVGPRFAIIRALAIDNDGSIWVGGFQTQRAYHINQNTGAQIEDVALGTTPYGFAIRGDYLYSAALGNRVVRVKKSDLSVKHLNGACGNYGMTVDQNGFMWTGGCGVARCDFDGQPENGSCVNFGGDGHSGITVDPDNQIWAAGSGRVQKYSNAGVLLGSVSVPGSPYGIAMASDDRIFVAGNLGVATVNRGPIGGAPGSVHLTGVMSYPGITYNWAYTYSDMTGFIARNIQNQTGRWSVVYDGVGADTIWTKVTWNVEPQGFTGAGATLTTSIRAANSPGDLGAQAFTVVSSGVDITGMGVTGRYVEVRVAFQRDLGAQQGPILSDLKVEGKSPNSPPVAQCTNATVCTDVGVCLHAALVDINNGSYDPDNDPLQFGYNPNSDYPLGPTVVTMTVSDGHESDSCTGTVTVNDCENPTIACPAPITVECSQGGGCQQITPASANPADNCSISSTSNEPAGCFPLGTTTTHYSTVDGSGNDASCTSSITVTDNTPPVVQVAGAGTLWPPNHKMVTIGLDQCGIVIADACRGGLPLGNASAAITCVSSDEVPDSLGDGNTEIDIVIVDATHVQVREERSGKLDGRVYKIGFTVSDGDGNTTAGVCKVTVPHSQGPKGAAVDSGVKYTVCAPGQ